MEPPESSLVQRWPIHFLKTFSKSDMGEVHKASRETKDKAFILGVPHLHVFTNLKFIFYFYGSVITYVWMIGSLISAN